MDRDGSLTMPEMARLVQRLLPRVTRAELLYFQVRGGGRRGGRAHPVPAVLPGDGRGGGGGGGPTRCQLYFQVTVEEGGREGGGGGMR